MRIFFVTILLVSFQSSKLYAQQLTIPETIDYINSILSDNGSAMWFEYVALSSTGELQIYNNYQKRTERMQIDQVELSTLRPSHTGSYFYIQCKNLYYPCISTDVKTGARKPPKNKKHVSVDDQYLQKKLYNAFIYLFAKVKEDGSYKFYDDDPFAPSNFGYNDVIVKGQSNVSDIQLSQSNGVYKVWVEIGNLKKQFILDTGASDVSISLELEKELINNKQIQKDDYIESALYRLADGSIVKCRRVVFPKIIVGGFTVYDVIASVGISDSPLLLGSSFLDNFAKWSIDNNTQILYLEK